MLKKIPNYASSLWFQQHGRPKKIASVIAIFCVLLSMTIQVNAQYLPTDDFDSDGIINSIDLDDDNDGVPDQTELQCFSLPDKTTMTATTGITTGAGNVSQTIDGAITNSFWFTTQTPAANATILEYTFPVAVKLTQIEIALNISNSFLRNACNYKIQGWNGTSYVDLTGTLVSDGVATATTTGGNPFSEVFDLSTNTNSYTKYKLVYLSGQIGNNPYVREAYFTGCATGNPDADGDAIANVFEIDSDNDGCSDAFEAGATTNTTANYTFSGPYGTNGLANSLETVADNGILNYTSLYNTYAVSSASNFCNLYSSASGKVFMDFDGNGIQSTHLQEPGMKNVTVNAYLPDGSVVSTLTDSLGEYSFSGSQIASGTPIRIEFVDLPSGMFDGFKGSGSNTTVQFTTASVGATTAGLAISVPHHFSSTLNPKFAFVQFKRNNAAATEQTIWFLNDNSSVNFIPDAPTDANRNWAMPNVSGVAAFPIPTRYEVANQGEVGASLGLAWDKRHQNLLAGTYMRAFTNMKSNSSANGFGEGVIYKVPINVSGNSASAPAVWLDLETYLGDNIAGTYIADGAYPGSGIYGRTNANPNKIGFTGLGMMKFTNDGSRLLVANLNSQEIFVIPVNPATGDAAVTSSSDILRFKLPTIEAPGSWANGNPYRAILGIGIHPVTGKAYVSMTCNGPTVANLKGVIYSFDPMDSTPDSNDFTKELEVPMNIIRPATNPNVLLWYAQINHAWENITANAVFYTNGASNNMQHTQPWLGEVVFDALPDGTFGMSIAERNRYHDAINGSFYVTGGEVYRAAYNGTQWVLENNKVAGPLTSTVNWSTVNANYAGSNTSATNKFYKYVGAEGSFAQGSITHVPGSNEVILPTMDNVFYSGTSGICWLNRITGERSRDTRHLSDFTATGYGNTPFTKSNNFGDIELLGDLPPLEIGNRVWLDTDSDGIQDADENGIAGVVVKLYQGTTQVAQTTTASDGTYYFTNANVNMNGATGILPNTAYEIRITNSQTPLATYILTGTNTDGTSNGDARDNDGNGLVTATIALTTGAYGENNHTYDFGYKQSSCTPPDAGADQTVCMTQTVTLTGINPTTGTWDENPSNPSGATLSSTLNGVATVTFTAAGTFEFIYSNAGCADTMLVNVNPNTASTTNVSICNTAVPYVWNGNNYSASGTYLYTTTNSNGCDSTATLNLTVMPPSTSTENVMVCTNSLPYVWNGNNYSVNGTYTFSTTNSMGCDSTATLNLTVSTTLTSSTNVSVCSDVLPYVWNGNNYNASGTYTFNTITSGGCDSIATLVLVVNNPSSTTLNDTICTDMIPYVWNSMNITTSGTYVFNTTNMDGCDSVVTLNLEVTPTAVIGNYVWFDDNANGLQDEASSLGINGVSVELYKETSPGSNVYALSQSTVTATNAGNPGYYQFEICGSGNYKVKFPLMNGSDVLTTQTTTPGTDNNSDASLMDGFSPVFFMNSNGSGLQLSNLTIDAGYYAPSSIPPTPTIAAYPNNMMCLNSNVQLIAYGLPGATFNWTTPSGFTGTIDNSISGQSILTIHQVSLADNGIYSVTQTVGSVTSTSASFTMNAGFKASFEYVSTMCLGSNGQVTLDVTPNTNMEYAINGGAFQLSNVFTVPSGATFVAAARPIGSSCVVYYTGHCVHCAISGSCTNMPTDSLAAPSEACIDNSIEIVNSFSNATSVTFTTNGSGTFDATTCTSSPCTIHYTPSASDLTLGNVIITATTNDPDGAGPCTAKSCSKSIVMLNGLVAPTITTTSPVCENSPLSFSHNSNVGSTSWLSINGYTSSINPDTVTSTPATMHGPLGVTLSAAGCTSVSSNTNVVVVAAPNLNVIVTPHDAVCAGQGNGSIEVSVIGGSGNYQICYNSNLSNCVNANYANFQYVASGNYTVTVVDQSCPGNIFSYPVTVNDGMVIAPPVVPSSINACAGDNVVLSGTSTGTINWTFSGNTFNALGNSVIRYNAQTWMSGVYTAKTFDANGCASVGVPVQITVGAVPVINHVQVNCLGNYSHIVVTASSTDPISYSFNGTSYQSSATFDSLPGGNYTLYVKNTVSNCVVTLAVHIPNCNCPNEPVINITAPQNSCGNTAIPLSASWTNAASATWTSSGSGNFDVSSGSSPLVNTYTPSSTDLSNGSVDLTLTTADPDGAGPCTPVSELIHINLLSTLPTPVISANQASYCTGDTVMLSANVALPIHWTGTGGFVSDSDVAYIPITTQFVSGPYTATITGNGCATTSAVYNLVVAPAPNLTVTTSVVNENCAGHANGEITVNVTGGSGTYKICNDFELNCSNTTSPYTFKYLAPATYAIHVSDATCPNARTVIPATVNSGLVVPPPVTANYNDPICEGEDLILTATGNNSLAYEWTDMTNSFIAQGVSVTRTNAQAGMSGKYKVVQLDNGCASTPLELNVMVYDIPEITLIDTMCLGGDSGRITITANIASGQQLEYALNDGAYQSSNVFDYLPNGLYQVRARAAGSQDCAHIVTGIELYCSCYCNKEAVVSVYPSPNTGKFTVNAELETESENIRYELFDFSGRKIYHEDTEEKTHIIQHTISIDQLAAGNYMLKVTVDLDSFIVPVSVANK